MRAMGNRIAAKLLDGGIADTSIEEFFLKKVRCKATQIAHEINCRIRPALTSTDIPFHSGSIIDRWGFGWSARRHLRLAEIGSFGRFIHKL